MVAQGNNAQSSHSVPLFARILDKKGIALPNVSTLIYDDPYANSGYNTKYRNEMDVYSGFNKLLAPQEIYETVEQIGNAILNKVDVNAYTNYVVEALQVYCSEQKLIDSKFLEDETNLKKERDEKIAEAKQLLAKDIGQEEIQLEKQKRKSQIARLEKSIKDNKEKLDKLLKEAEIDPSKSDNQKHLEDIEKTKRIIANFEATKEKAAEILNLLNTDARPFIDEKKEEIKAESKQLIAEAEEAYSRQKASLFDRLLYNEFISIEQEKAGTINGKHVTFFPANRTLTPKGVLALINHFHLLQEKHK
jgi:hypothetical protein